VKKALIFLSAAAFVGLLVFRVIEARNKAKPAETAERIFPVRVATLQPRDVPHVILLTGNIKPKHEVDIAAKIGGRVEKIVADLGDRVKDGGALAVIEHREIALQLKQAEAGLAAAKVGARNAEDEYNRGVKLHEAGALSDSQLDGMRTRAEASKAQFLQADAAVGLAREALRNATISAPIGGLVTRRTVELGQMVNPGVPVYQVQEASVMKFSAGIEAANFKSVQKGMPVAIYVDAFPGEAFEGTIARISPALDPYTRRATVEIEIKNKESKLLANMFARGVVQVGEEKNALALPPSAVVEDGQQKAVFVAAEGKAAKRPVELKFANDEVAVLKSGVQTGEMVVVAGQELLSDGAKVEIQETDVEKLQGPEK
jgi:RND family efflux transporter MFP subunit